ncbi:MAG: hypothetical protein WCE94_03005 [Candidatus Methanoperedens sp.]
MIRELLALVLVVTLVTGICSVAKGPYPHKEIMKPVIMQKYPDVNISKSYDRKYVAPIKKIKKKTTSKKKKAANNNPRNDSTGMKQNSTITKDGVTYGI